MNDMKKINSLSDLSTYLSAKMMQQIRTQARNGDPDWLLDILNELNYITPDSPFYIPDFHGVLRDKGITADDFNIEPITKEIYAL